MNYLQRRIYELAAQRPAMLPAGGRRIQPLLPPHVRLRTPNAGPSETWGYCPPGTIRKTFESPPGSGNMITQCVNRIKVGPNSPFDDKKPGDDWRTLAFRRPNGAPSPQGAGINMQCPQGQAPQTFESPPGSGNMITQCQPLRITNTNTKDTPGVGDGAKPNWRGLRFRGLPGGARPAGAGGALNCPPGQQATWFESPPSSGNMILQCQPLRITLKERNKPQGDASGGQNCPQGQIAQWVSSPGHPPTLECRPPPLAAAADKNAQFDTGLPWRVRYASRFANPPVSRSFRFVPGMLPEG